MVALAAPLAFVASGPLQWVGLALIVTTTVAALDEIQNLNVGVRLGLQVFAAVIVVLGVGLVRRVELPTGNLALGAASIPLTIVWIVAFINVYNFMDGVNGIASIQGVVGGTVLSVLLALHGDVAGASLAAAAAGAAAGFLPWNLRNAVFMGDIGSTGLGLVFAALTIRASSVGVGLVAAALPFAAFIFDVALTLVVRTAQGDSPLWKAHRQHLYQRLTRSGWSHFSVAVLWGFFAVLAGALGLVYEALAPPAQAFGLIALLLVLAAAAVRIYAFQRASTPTGKADPSGSD
jgi:UDP-N-acetylmuramyl pentapeptide phosphotransferase/UDP-N-acetylglucosamine-1-phosphate transferase